jgi:hypothetical protein
MTRAGFSGPPRKYQLLNPMKTVLVLLAAALLSATLSPLHADGGRSGDDRAERKQKVTG